MPTADSFPKLIVGLGASAGGLEALEQFFSVVPAETGIAFVVVQHLSPDFESHMEELLARKLALSVTTAEDGIIVEANKVYLLPPGKEIEILDGALFLRPKPRSSSPTFPIDRFFSSLADEKASGAVAVVLSGTGSDGSRGLREVHASGGLAIAQEPATAKFDGMPSSAIATGVAHAILPADECWTIIARYRDGVERQQLRKEGGEKLSEEKRYQQILELLRLEHEIDFAQYKSTTIRRRIQRRVEMLGLELQDYVDLLSSTKEELGALYSDLLIGVTEFFRDPEAFAFLGEKVIPQIVSDHRNTKGGIRIWVAGCSTGEEAYSLAMLLDEAIGDRSIPFKIFATDLHLGALETAGKGCYSGESLAAISNNRIRTYFEEKEGSYQVVDRLRKKIVFAHHDLVTSAPFTRMDLVSCRNLLIYLRPEAQRRALSLIHFGLKANGYFFGGASETLGELESEFEAVEKNFRISRKLRDIRLISPREPGDFSVITGRESATSGNPARSIQPDSGELSFRELLTLYDSILSDYMPVGVIVGPDGNMIHSFEGIGEFYKVQSGRPTNQIFDVILDDLRPSARSALQRCIRSNAPVQFANLPIEKSSGSELVTLSVSPYRFSQAEDNSQCYLITIEPGASSIPIRPEKKPGKAAVVDLQGERKRIEELESELLLLRENLQGTVEELETSNEELQATNEELVASNEELQSTNEELHSVNEEIHTVNSELRRKISEISEMSADMEALFESTDVGVIFLDLNLCIRRFTPRVTDYFSLVPSDEGRPLSHFSHRINDSRFMEDAALVLETESIIERELQTEDHESLLFRALPYRLHDEMQGVILTFVDLTRVKSAEESVMRLAKIVESSLSAIVSVDRNNVVKTWNSAASEMFGYSEKEAIGANITDLVSPPGKEKEFNITWEKANNEPIKSITTRTHKDGHEIDVQVVLSPIFDDAGDPIGRSAFVTDITERISYQRRLKIKNAVSEILFTMTNPRDAAGEILRKIINVFPRTVAAEYWEIEPESRELVMQRCEVSEAPEAVPISCKIIQERESVLSIHDAPREILRAIEAHEPSEVGALDDFVRQVGFPASRVDGLEGIVVFPVVHDEVCSGLFVVYSQRRQENPPILASASSLGRVIGHYFYLKNENSPEYSATGPCWYASFDAEGRYQSTTSRYFGRSSPDIVGKSDEELMAGEAGARLRAEKRKVIETGNLSVFTLVTKAPLVAGRWEIQLLPYARSGESEEITGGTMIASQLR